MSIDAEEIKTTVDILQLVGGDTTLKKVSSSGGGEWEGACPFCGGIDRFRVQPNRSDGGHWYCRNCGEGKWHSVIDYAMLKNGMEFTEALAYLAGGQFNQQEEAKPLPQTKPKVNREIWVNAARQFAAECAEDLWTDPQASSALLYLDKRGLSESTLHAYGIGFNPVDNWGIPEAWGLVADDQIFLPRGITIPCHSDDNLEYVKVRRSTGPNKYQIIKGGHPYLFGASSFHDAMIAFLFESELDAMLAWQTGLVLGYGALPAGQTLKDEYLKYFKGLESLIVAYDQDLPGQKAADKLCLLSKNIHKAGPLPYGKDLTEYYQHTGNQDVVLDWLLLQLDLIGGKHDTG